MPKGNKFGFEPLQASLSKSKKERAPGPMGKAVREAAESLTETTESKLEQRRQNAAEAKAFREAQADGRVLLSLGLEEVHTDDLPRDRLELEAVASSDEMEELKSSIRARGQKEPVEVYLGDDGRYQLKKGWRRFTALSQLLEETGDPDFKSIVARIADVAEVRIARYIDMVEENVVREDLTFAEMAQVALTAAQDPRISEDDPEQLVGRLYASLHKMKRSYIRAFVFLLEQLEDAVQFPKSISRNLGADVARVLKTGQGDVEVLKASLRDVGSPQAQAACLEEFVQSAKAPLDKGPVVAPAPREKFEFHVGKTKVTARKGECRIVNKIDFTAVSKERLAEAIEAFEAKLQGE